MGTCHASDMASILKFGLNVIADMFYPKYCFGCRRAGSYLCKFCMTQIPDVAQHFCIVCNSVARQGFTHTQCLGPLKPERMLNAFPYQNAVVSDMIITGKYYFIPEVFAVLGAMCADSLFLSARPQENLSGFIICPIPLHPTRERWRGFNQSGIAASMIAKGLNLPYASLLIRLKKTQTQKDLDADERRTNMDGAFQVSPLHRVRGYKILLIDDVTTTGQTFLDATRALKSAGAEEVWCVSIAKD